MTEREKILGRVREALRLSAPLPGQHHGNGHGHAAPLPRSASTGAREWLPPVGSSHDDQAKSFAACALDLKADFHWLESAEALAPTLQKIRDTEGWKRAASHAGALTDVACRALNLPTLRTDQGYDVNELEACDVGITECDALVAQTGSVVITSRSAGGRALSVLPPHHLVIARRDQLVADLPAAFELLQRKYAGNYPSFMSLVTGPSRTGDIERILVLGAHGPKKLTIVGY
jgi:L-lactate dehydrogenase complex protein LldG